MDNERASWKLRAGDMIFECESGNYAEVAEVSDGQVGIESDDGVEYISEALVTALINSGEFVVAGGTDTLTG